MQNFSAVAGLNSFLSSLKFSDALRAKVMNTTAVRAAEFLGFGMLGSAGELLQ